MKSHFYHPTFINGFFIFTLVKIRHVYICVWEKAIKFICNWVYVFSLPSTVFSFLLTIIFIAYSATNKAFICLFQGFFLFLFNNFWFESPQFQWKFNCVWLKSSGKLMNAYISITHLHTCIKRKKKSFRSNQTNWMIPLSTSNLKVTVVFD